MARDDHRGSTGRLGQHVTSARFVRTRYHVPMPDDDAVLLGRWRGGDASAGQELLRRHFRSVYLFFANKIGGGTDDLIQETFKACVEGRDRIREGSSFRAYLLGTARYHLYASYRRQRESEVFDPGQLSVAELADSPSVLIAKHENQRLLLAALRSIPLEYQLVLELTYWESLSSAEAAEVVGVPIGTLKSRLRRAKEALGNRFADLSTTTDLRELTVDDLERWARSMREELAARA